MEREPFSRAIRYDRVVSPLAAVIFDFDGVVLDSETPEYESHRRIYERCGAVLTADRQSTPVRTERDRLELTDPGVGNAHRPGGTAPPVALPPTTNPIPPGPTGRRVR